MPTQYIDQFFVMDPAKPAPIGSPLTFVKYTITDQNNDNLIDAPSLDSVNGVDILRSWPGDRITIDVPGVGRVTYTGITFYLAGGAAVFTPTDGQVLQNGTLVSTTWVSKEGPLRVSALGPPCFVTGTLIATPSGQRRIEDIRVGDLVLTVDHGACAVRWVGARTIDAADLATHPNLRPVRIAAGALGCGLPFEDLVVSQQHRVLVKSSIAERLFESREVLVAAKKLLALDGFSIDAGLDHVEYHHMLFDRHEVVIANGAQTESLFIGPEARKSLGSAAMDEILILFPELGLRAAQDGPVAARPFASGRDALQLAMRHRKNAKPLVSHLAPVSV